MHCPYLNPADLSPRMTARPRRPFVVRPGDYRVVDGDTVAILAPPPLPSLQNPRAALNGNAGRKTAFLMRMRTVNSQEMPARTGATDLLEQAGYDPHANHPAILARNALRALTKDRALHVVPYGLDAHGRLLCDLTASSRKGPLFALKGAFSLEAVLYEMGLVNGMGDKGEVPPRHPDLSQSALQRREMPQPVPVEPPKAEAQSASGRMLQNTLFACMFGADLPRPF